MDAAEVTREEGVDDGVSKGDSTGDGAMLLDITILSE